MPLRIEWIISQEPFTPQGRWYDQRQDEWVMVSQGAARLRFESPDELMEMRPGDLGHDSGSSPPPG